mgnify:CR=1 FL=1
METCGNCSAQADEVLCQGVNLGAIKELQAMSELAHDHLIRLQDVYFHADRVNMVLGENTASLLYTLPIHTMLHAATCRIRCN